MKFSTIFTLNSLAAVMLVVVLYVFEQQSHATQQALDKAERQTYQLALHTEKLQRLLVDRETGQRGYLLTLDKFFLEPYLQAQGELAEILERLEPSFDSTTFATLKNTIQERATYFQASFDLIEQQQQTIASFISEGRGKVFMDSMRNILNKQVALKQDKLAKLEVEHDNSIANEHFFTAIFAGFIVLSNFGFLLFSHVKISQPIQHVIAFLNRFAQSRQTLFDLKKTGIAETDALITNLQSMAQIITDNEQHLENEKRAKDRFLSNMSHELRTPLNGIYGALQLVEGTNETEKSLLEAAKHSTEALTEIIGSILDSQRITEGKFHLAEDWFACEEVFDNVFQLKRVVAELKSIQFDVIYTSDIPDEIYIDKLRLSQILNNVVGNAIKFTDKGYVSVSVEFNHALIIRVRDTGIGMSEELQNHIFERFLQADDSISKRFQGAGLGLAITKQLVELMSGSISVSSTPNMGSEFTITLPVATRTLSANKPQEVKHHATFSASLRILYVDDSSTNLIVGKVAIANHFPNVETASSGKEALEKLQQHNYDIVITDIGMPHMSGEELLVEIKRSYPQIPVMALTGNAGKDDIEGYLAQGFVDVITKPFNADKLIAAIDALSSQKSTILGNDTNS